MYQLGIVLENCVDFLVDFEQTHFDWSTDIEHNIIPLGVSL